METPGAYPMVLAGLLFLAAVTGRNICNIGFIERPLVIGFAWWLCTGQYSPALPLALFFELFWLDLFHIGGYIPPMGAFPYLLLLLLSSRFGWSTPAAFTFPLAMLLPLAYLLPYAESRQRDYQKNASSLLLRRARGNAPLGGLPAQQITISIVQQIVIALSLFIAATAACHTVFSLNVLEEKTGGIVLNVDWPVLYAIAAIGSLISLRIKRAYIVFSLCSIVIFVFKFV